MSELHSKVRAWLEGTGFPLEMRAASYFRAAGFEVRQAGTYVDPISSKGREIDVLAEDPDLIGIVNISVVVECKTSANPWIVLVSDVALEGYNRLFAMGVSSDSAREYLWDEFRKTDWKKKPLAFELPNRGGYGLRQAFAKDQDPAYSASSGLLSASFGIAGDGGSKQHPRLSFAFPVLVVDSPIIECELGSNGGLVLSEVQSSLVVCSAHLPTAVRSCIRIVHASGLEGAAREIKAQADDLRKFLAPAEKRIIDSWGESGA